MKAPAFRYHAAENRADALEVLKQHGEDAQILAGGQSLMPVMAFRLATPALLVDINRVDDLTGISAERGRVRIGALVRHAEVATSVTVGERLPMIAEAVRHVAHPAVRNRGTFGGSVALADPAAEFPACCVALGAEIGLESAARGHRTVPAGRFYRGLFETARAPDEAVTEVWFPDAAPGERCGFAEFSRRHGDFAVSGIAVRVRFARDGRTVDDLTLVPFGSEPFPRICLAAGRAAKGERLEPATIEAVAAALADDIEPMPSQGAGKAYKRHLARTLCRRVLASLAEEAPA